MLLTAARASGVTGRKDECQLRLTGIEQEYWMSTEIGRLRGYGFRGIVLMDAGCNQQGGEMKAEYVNLLRVRESAAYVNMYLYLYMIKYGCMYEYKYIHVNL